MAAVPLRTVLDERPIAERMRALPVCWQRLVASAWIQRLLPAAHPWVRPDVAAAIQSAAQHLASSAEEGLEHERELRALIRNRTPAEPVLTSSANAEGFVGSIAMAALHGLRLGFEGAAVARVAQLANVFLYLSVREDMRRRGHDRVVPYIRWPEDHESRWERIEGSPALCGEAHAFLGVLDHAEQLAKEDVAPDGSPPVRYFGNCWQGPLELAAYLAPTGSA